MLVGGLLSLFLTGFTEHSVGTLGLKAIWKEQPSGICSHKHKATITLKTAFQTWPFQTEGSFSSPSHLFQPCLQKADLFGEV